MRKVGSSALGVLNSDFGFTLVELLIALTITLLIAGAIAAATPAARAAFDRVPAELEMQQRGRTAIDVLSQALRAADRISFAIPNEDDSYEEVTVIIPVVNASQGVLSIDQTSLAGPMTLVATSCPDVKDVCGFTVGAAAMICDDLGHSDVFVVKATSSTLRRITPDRGLSQTYPAGSSVVEIEESTFGLDEQPDGTYTLTRVTAAGAVQPIVDFISALVFRDDGDRVRVDVTVHAAVESMRHVIADRRFSTVIAVRNIS